jgi:hypothetical protein
MDNWNYYGDDNGFSSVTQYDAQSYGVPYGWNDQDVINFFGNDPSGSGTYNYANWLSDGSTASFVDPSSPGFFSGLGSAIGSGVNSLTSGLKDSGLGTLAGMIGAGYGIKNQIDWQELLSQGRDLADKTGSLISGYTPYNDQMVNMSAAQKQGVGYAPGLLEKGNQLLTGSGTYDPSQIQSYLNPYVEGGLAAANRLTTQNLNENILPQINSTFTGHGQFGSTRNADFQNRAIRDTQQAIADANAKGMVGAYGQASSDYMDMLKQQGAQGQNMLNQGMTLGALPVQQYENMFKSPLDMFKSWGQSVGNFNPAGTGAAGSMPNDLQKLFGG